MSTKLFKLERGIPMTYTRGSSIEQIKIRAQVKDLGSKMKVGQSFCVPKSTKSTILKYLRTEFPELHFRSGAVAGNPKVVRIWRKV
jgi:hypothetical protein